MRHATLVIGINNKHILVDPMLSPKNALDPVQNCGNETRFPMVDLPISDPELYELLQEVEAVIVSHLHRDHWDTAAQKLINKDKIIFCQPADTEKIKEAGFRNVQPINDQIHWEGISIHRTNGQHGTGEIGKKMGQVSGFVLQHNDESIYVAGDTIFCKEMQDALSQFHPTVTIVNAGGARFLEGGPITMTPSDVIRVNEEFPDTKIIAVHMDTVNHCFDKRTDLLEALSKKRITSVLVPMDGETVQF